MSTIIKSSLVLFSLTIGIQPSDTWAQDSVSPPKRQVEEFVDRYEKMFANRPPVVGQALPDAAAFDESGDPFELSQTRGKFTVIIFGCLT